jgi:sulfonate transport system substrate-binding protein
LSSLLAKISLCLLALSALLSAQTRTTLKVAVNSTTIESFPVFAAVDSLPSVEIVPTDNGRNAMARLVAGSVDVATGSETQALLNSVMDTRIRIILTLSECRYRVVARRSAGIQRVADLRGKKVAATLNTSSAYYLSRMLAKAHVDESGVQVVAMEGQAMPAALAKRDVDAVSIWEPHAQNSLEALAGDFVILEDPAAYTERFNLNTRTDVLSEPTKRAALGSLIEEIARASGRLRTESSEIIPSLAPKVNTPARTVMAVWPQFKFPAALSQGLQASLEEVEPWVAATQNRQPRTNKDLSVLIDRSLTAK